MLILAFVTSLIGARTRRLEDPRLLTGRGRYAGDIQLEGLLHLAIVRSPSARGRLTSIDQSGARAVRGLVELWTAADLPEGAREMSDWLPPDLEARARPVLAAGAVRSIGDPIACVIAESEYAAADAAAAVFAEIEPLPATGTLEAALDPSSPRVYDDMDSNLVRAKSWEYGDVETAFAGAPLVTAVRLAASKICGAAMEPREVTARRDGDQLTVWASTQGVFNVRTELAARLGLEQEQIHVLADDVGGGFGPKGTVYPEEVLVGLAAWKLNRPVRWTASRSEDTATTVHAHGTILELEVAAGADGRIRGIRGTVHHDVGAYATSGVNQPNNIVPHLMSAYRIPAFRVEARTYFTNSAPTGFVRGGGRPLGNYGIERLLNELARKAGLDPAELRRRNLVQPEQMPYDTGMPQGRKTVVYDSGNYPALLEAALERIGYEQIRAEQRSGGGRLVGVGVASCVEEAGFGRGEPARVRLEKDGSAHLFIGSTPQGQGHETMAAIVLADRLGWPLERIRVRVADTHAVPNALFTAGSRSAIHVGNAVSLAATSARTRLLEEAAEVLEADPADLVLEAGVISVRGAPGKSLPVSEAIPAEGLEVVEQWDPPRPAAYSSGCHAAVVEVDAATGGVKLLRYVIAYDTGQAINRTTLEGQLQGGWVHGLGYALFEEAVYQPDGAFLSASFLDYTIASAPEASAPLDLVSLNKATDSNPVGVKGAGESGTIPVPACIANAVEDAIRQVRPDAFIDRIPLTPQRLHALISG